MPEYYQTDQTDITGYVQKQKKESFLIHLGLFIITFITTTVAGAEWTTGTMGPYELSHLLIGLPYSVAIMFIISSHEFGHYFAARYHKVKATLPYYITRFPEFRYNGSGYKNKISCNFKESDV